MIFKGINDQIVKFQLEYHDSEKNTGFKEEPIYRGLRIEIREFRIEICILISDVEKIVHWFENHLLNKSNESIVYTLDDQLYFTLLKNNSKSKIIRITYDSTVPVDGIGAYSLSPGAKYEDFYKKSIVECEMNETELQRIVKGLKIELDNSVKNKF